MVFISFCIFDLNQFLNCNGTVVCRKKGVEDELGPQARSGLRMMLALDEERVARSFTSCFPNFAKIMKKFNISGSYTLVTLTDHACLIYILFLKIDFGINFLFICLFIFLFVY